MNRATFIALLAFGSLAANSQITKGNWMLGGTISYASTNYKDSGHLYLSRTIHQHNI